MYESEIWQELERIQIQRRFMLTLFMVMKENQYSKSNCNYGHIKISRYNKEVPMSMYNIYIQY